MNNFLNAAGSLLELAPPAVDRVRAMSGVAPKSALELYCEAYRAYGDALAGAVREWGERHRQAIQAPLRETIERLLDHDVQQRRALARQFSETMASFRKARESLWRQWQQSVQQQRASLRASLRAVARQDPEAATGQAMSKSRPAVAEDDHSGS